MFRHQKPLSADFLGYEKMIPGTSIRQSGKNMLMTMLLQQYLETALVRPIPGSAESLKSMKHYDPSHGYVSLRHGKEDQLLANRVWDETLNPIMQAVMSMVDKAAIHGDWWGLDQRTPDEIKTQLVADIFRATRDHPEILTDVWTPEEVLEMTQRMRLHGLPWKPHVYQQDAIYDTEIGTPISKLH